jgi:hypothetical protein
LSELRSEAHKTAATVRMVMSHPALAPTSGNLLMCPLGSYGRRNRQAIAARETRVATRLRAVARAYRMTIDHDSTLKPPEPIAAPSSPQPPADREIELE